MSFVILEPLTPESAQSQARQERAARDLTLRSERGDEFGGAGPVRGLKLSALTVLAPMMADGVVIILKEATAQERRRRDAVALYLECVPDLTTSLTADIVGSDCEPGLGAGRLIVRWVGKWRLRLGTKKNLGQR